MSRVLIIDDHQDARMLASARLKSDAYQLYEADNGDQGIRIALEVLPDVILLDYDMPDKDGFTTLKEMLEYPELNNIPIIFLSAETKAKNKVKGLDLGAFDYITKPFDPFELRARVRVAMRVKRLQDMLFQEAHLDPLTGINNRRSFDIFLKKEWERFKRYGHYFSVMMLDLDHFKKVNDVYGHGIGDQALQHLASTLDQAKRNSDFLARYGGEEFVIILPEQKAKDGVIIAERMMADIREIRIPTSQGELSMTCSMGIAEVKDQSTAEELVMQADQALYYAKSAGRDRVVTFDQESD